MRRRIEDGFEGSHEVLRRKPLRIVCGSQFHNCSIIWRPTTQSLTCKVESIQKRAIKWILSEENISYSPYSVYLRKCRQINLLPMSSLFDLFELLYFHKVMYSLTPTALPSYLTFYQGTSRLRSCHLDDLSLVSSISPQASPNMLSKSFFYRTHFQWNRLPRSVREIEEHLIFKKELISHLWKRILLELDDDDAILPQYDDDLPHDNG